MPEPTEQERRQADATRQARELIERELRSQERGWGGAARQARELIEQELRSQERGQGGVESAPHSDGSDARGVAAQQSSPGAGHSQAEGASGDDDELDRAAQVALQAVRRLWNRLRTAVGLPPRAPEKVPEQQPHFDPTTAQASPDFQQQVPQSPMQGQAWGPAHHPSQAHPQQSPFPQAPAWQSPVQGQAWGQQGPMQGQVQGPWQAQGPARQPPAQTSRRGLPGVDADVEKELLRLITSEPRYTDAYDKGRLPETGAYAGNAHVRELEKERAGAQRAAAEEERARIAASARASVAALNPEQSRQRDWDPVKPRGPRPSPAVTPDRAPSRRGMSK
ncbi:hypothetical protein ABZ820_18625 [Streptomyces diacarni]|uniref:hypothetical protein n=1 Tax=Streptomyces diacarni TaxID=2800381 RepID=UPI0033EE75A9